jgi:dipeptidyl aminopeptidase/acylaminoacyl peptidase
LQYIVQSLINAMRAIILLFTIQFSFCASSQSQSLNTIVHEDMWLMKRVGAPSLSPDGKWVIFSVLDPAYNEKDQINDLWICPTDKSEAPRRLTAMKAGESSYSWSPDGKYIAFIAKRDGDEESQIYTMNMRGGEAQKFTTLSTGASSPKWSPDGKKILFTSSVFPLCYADSTNKKKIEEKKNLKYKARVYDSFPIRNWDKWLDEKQSHVYIQHIDSISAHNILTDAPLTKEAGFALGSFAWVDNDNVVFTATTQANTGAYHDPFFQIYKCNYKRNDITQLTKDNVNHSNVLISKDGKYIYCLEGKEAYKVYVMDVLVRYDFPSLTNRKELNAQLDRPINSYEIVENGVLSSVESEGRDRLYLFAFDGAVKPITTGDKGCYTNGVRKSNETVASFESCIMPSEIVKINADGSHEFLTSFNKEKLTKLDLAYPETFYTKTSRGKSIRSMLVRPAQFDKTKKYPLFVMMHGGPAISIKENWAYRWHPHVLAGADYAIVMTDYTGSTGYGEKFSQDIQYDPFRGPAQEINEAAAEAIKKYSFIDASRQAAGGASYGGHLANWMQASTAHYKCLIAHAGLVNSISQWGTSDYIWGREVMNGGAPWTDAKVWQDQNPMKYAANFKTPILLTVGENDFRVPLNNTIESFHIHQRLKVPSKLIVFPEENHWILKAENSKFHYKEIREWLNKWL